MVLLTATVYRNPTRTDRYFKSRHLIHVQESVLLSKFGRVTNMIENLKEEDKIPTYTEHFQVSYDNGTIRAGFKELPSDSADTE